MATIKNFTSVEQSRKLAEILPSESADMEYMFLKRDGSKVSNVPFVKDNEEPEWPNDSSYDFILCWSLAALLDILAEQDFIIKSLERNNECQYNIDIPSRHCKIWFSSLLDAVFEMICWLKENNLL